MKTLRKYFDKNLEKGYIKLSTLLVRYPFFFILKKNGKEKTYAMINDQNPEFKIQDLYLFSGELKAGPLAAHGANRKMVGKDMSMLKDADGNSIAQKILDVANSKDGKGWADYKWPDPVTKEIEQKSTYVERVDDIYFACGIYK